jgi:hypothetical protein
VVGRCCEVEPTRPLGALGLSKRVWHGDAPAVEWGLTGVRRSRWSGAQTEAGRVASHEVHGDR